jgi:helicase
VRFFDGRFLDVYEQNRERLEARMGRYVRSVTRAFFSCHCRGRPFCGCPERAFTAYVLSLRRAGLDPRSISKRALKDWWLSVYSGDVVRWLDDAIRWLEAREEVARIRGAADAARSTRELRARLSGRSQPSWSNDG